MGKIDENSSILISKNGAKYSSTGTTLVNGYANGIDCQVVA